MALARPQSACMLSGSIASACRQEAMAYWSITAIGRSVGLLLVLVAVGLVFAAVGWLKADDGDWRWP